MINCIGEECYSSPEKRKTVIKSRLAHIVLQKWQQGVVNGDGKFSEKAFQVSKHQRHHHQHVLVRIGHA